jgi:hypothetical protein
MSLQQAPRHLPPWATLEESHFERYGLLVERLLDGSTVSNIAVIGGLAGMPVPPVWSEAGTPRFLLALSVVVRMMAVPDEESSIMAPSFTHRYRSLVRGTNTLDDGTRVTPWHTAIARKFENQYLAAAKDENTLTIPIETIKHALLTYMHELYSDR